MTACAVRRSCRADRVFVDETSGRLGNPDARLRYSTSRNFWRVPVREGWSGLDGASRTTELQRAETVGTLISIHSRSCALTSSTVVETPKRAWHVVVSCRCSAVLSLAASPNRHISLPHTLRQQSLRHVHQPRNHLDPTKMRRICVSGDELWGGTCRGQTRLVHGRSCLHAPPDQTAYTRFPSSACMPATSYTRQWNDRIRLNERRWYPHRPKTTRGDTWDRFRLNAYVVSCPRAADVFLRWGK